MGGTGWHWAVIGALLLGAVPAAAGAPLQGARALVAEPASGDRESDPVGAAREWQGQSEVVAYDRAHRYLDVVLQQRLVAVAEDNSAFHALLVADLTEGVARGLISVADRQQAEARLQAARLRVVEAQRDLETAAIAYQQRADRPASADSSGPSAVLPSPWSPAEPTDPGAALHAEPESQPEWRRFRHQDRLLARLRERGVALDGRLLSYRDQVNGGSRPLVDLLDAQDLRFQVQQQVETAHLARLLAQYRALAAAGRLAALLDQELPQLALAGGSRPGGADPLLPPDRQEDGLAVVGDAASAAGAGRPGSPAPLEWRSLPPRRDWPAPVALFPAVRPPPGDRPAWSASRAFVIAPDSG